MGTYPEIQLHTRNIISIEPILASKYHRMNRYLNIYKILEIYIDTYYNSNMMVKIYHECSCLNINIQNQTHH